MGVTVFVEGEEESGSPSLAELLAAHKDKLAADVIVIADSDNWSADVPALTVSLRGLADCVVEVATLDHGLHSGMWGGVVPDAMMVLTRLLASLHDDDGNVAVAGLHEGRRPTSTARRSRVREETGLLDGVREIGTGTVAQRLWAKPAITVIGIDATPIAQSSNTLLPQGAGEGQHAGRSGWRRKGAPRRAAAAISSRTPRGARESPSRRATSASRTRSTPAGRSSTRRERRFARHGAPIRSTWVRAVRSRSSRRSPTRSQTRKFS